MFKNSRFIISFGDYIENRDVVKSEEKQFLILKYHRVQEAKNLLCATRMPVTEVCSAAGFESISYFSKILKRLVVNSATSISPYFIFGQKRAEFLDLSF